MPTTPIRAYIDALCQQRESILQSLNDQFDKHGEWIEALVLSARTLVPCPPMPSEVVLLHDEYNAESARLRHNLQGYGRWENILNRLQDIHEGLLEMAFAESVRFQPPMSRTLQGLADRHKELVANALARAGKPSEPESPGGRFKLDDATYTITLDDKRFRIAANPAQIMAETPESNGR